MAAGTGLRQGEAFGLTLDRVDFLRRTLTVDRQLVLLAGQKPRDGPPKTRASYRVLPLPRVVLVTLAEHLREFPVVDNGLVFATEAGAPLNRTRFSASVWRPAVQRVGVEGATFHDLRHYYASLLIRHGESVKVVQARLGQCHGRRDAGHLLASLARLRGPDAGGDRRRSRRSCGPLAD